MCAPGGHDAEAMGRPSQCIRSGNTCVITFHPAEVSFDHLVKAMSFGFLCHKVRIFSFLISKSIVRSYFVSM